MPSGPRTCRICQSGAKAPNAARRDSVEQVVPQHQREAERRDRGAGQVDQPGQHHHRGADRPDHLCADAHGPPGGEVPPEADHRRLQQDQPQPASEEEASQLAAAAARARDPCAGAGEEDEDRRAVVGNPAGAEERQVGAGQVGGVEPELGEVGPDVIQHHDDHDYAAKQVHVVEAARWSGPGAQSRLERARGIRYSPDGGSGRSTVLMSRPLGLAVSGAGFSEGPTSYAREATQERTAAAWAISFSVLA